jgi:hypothetical protein
MQVYIEEWMSRSPPFGTFLLCKIKSVHLKIPQGIGSEFSLPFHTSNCQIVIVASIIPHINTTRLQNPLQSRNMLELRRTGAAISFFDTQVTRNGSEGFIPKPWLIFAGR